jgi:hypothetical protein
MGAETTFAGLIAAPQSEKVFLCEAKPGELVTNFTLTTAQTYTYQISYLNETITLADLKTETTRKAVVACELDGVALLVKTSIATVEATAGTYWHDTANALLYIHPPDDGSPNHHTVIVYFWVYFATKGIVLNSLYYEPYIAESGIPQIKQESQSIHWGASQISSGSVLLLNNRGYFDQIAKRWIWNNKDIRILLGGDSLAYAEYTCIFAGRIMQSSFTKTEFSLSIESKSFALLRTLPINSFWATTWPHLDPAAEGKPLPYYWGIYSAAQAPIVTCIDSEYDINNNIFQFKICDCAFHAIKDITQVYIDYGDGVGWQAIAHANEDLTNATFTITAPAFVLGTSRVKVAFEGYHSGGVIIDGAPEFVEDLLLNQCGYVAADLNTTSFTSSKTTSTCVLNVPVEAETDALAIIETACQSDLAFFDEDGDGLLRYRTWTPSATGTVPVLAKEDILESPAIVDDTSQLYWKVKASYSWMGETGESLYTEASNSESKYKYGRDDFLTIISYLRGKADADEVAARINWVTRNPSPMITLKLKAGLIDNTLGDKLKVTISRAPFSAVGGYTERVFEIISKQVSCFPLFVTLKGRDLMDWCIDVGLWTAATAPDYDDATQQEKEASGFWCDDNGYCLTADSASLNKSLWW